MSQNLFNLPNVVLKSTGGFVYNSNVNVLGDLTVQNTLSASNLTILGDYTVLNTLTSNTDQMVVNNAGTGPALIVRQTGAHPVAEFIDAESGTALFIGNNGNVGIGTGISFEKFQVEGNVALSGGDRFIGTRTGHELSLRTNNVDRVNINTVGNVGIGTAIELERLHVEGNVALSGGDRFIGTTTNHGLNVRTNNTNRITVLSNGNVGIGTTNPQANLHVQGNGLFSGYVLQNGVPYCLANTVTSLGTNYPFRFTAVSNNVGNHYNSTNGRFTCPIQGKYFISYGIRADSIAPNQYIEGLIRVNDVNYLFTNILTAIISSATTIQKQSMSVILNLNANDYIDIWNTSTGGVLTSAATNSFLCIYFLG